MDRTGPHHEWTGARSERGIGQIRIDGKLLTAPRVAWTRAFGEPPPGAKVLACPQEPACVRADHLRLDVGDAKATSSKVRARPGAGSMSEVGDGSWKLVVSAGHDDTGARRRVVRTVHGSQQTATKALAAVVTEIGDGSRLPRRTNQAVTVSELVAWYLDFARNERGLEHSTLTGYSEVYDNWIQPSLGSGRASSVQPGDLDKVFGKMRRAKLSRSRMNNARAVLSGAYKWGKRHHMVADNPVDGFELPTSLRSPRTTTAPEIDELVRILDAADEHDPILAPVLKLGATTGMRRGELAGLRRDRLHLDRLELVVDTAVNDAGGVVVEKPTKTHRRRTVSIDAGTAALLRDHLAQMDQRAATCGAVVTHGAFVFSLDVTCETPLRPEFLTRRMRALRGTLPNGPADFDATILALRKWTSSELMDAGFNPSAVSDRQGHTVQVMLHHYSSRRRSADRAAADHLGARVHGSTVPLPGSTTRPPETRPTSAAPRRNPPQ